MIIVTIIYYPFRICFVDDIDYDDLLLFYNFFDCFFMIDIFINCLSSYYDDKNQLVFTPRTILLNYLKGMFIFDFLAVFPYESI